MKRIAALFLIIVMVFSSTPFSSFAQGFINPFANEDAVRLETIVSSQQQADLQTALSAEKRDTSAVDRIENGYIVQFKQSISLYAIYQCVSMYPYKLLSDSEDRWFEIGIDNYSSFNDMYGNLVELISENKELTVEAIPDPDDTYYSEQWALTDINLPAAWDVTTGSAEVKIAVIDTGFYRSHEDLSNTTVVNGFDVLTGIEYVGSDEVGHGTMVTSVIAATTNNATGIAGACWNATIVPYKVAYDDGTIDSANAIYAIKMAVQAGCDVINMSFGAYEFSKAEQAAIDAAVKSGCIVVAAAGNEGSSSDIKKGMLCYPASADGVISVASISSNNKRSYFSQYNTKVDVCAPGQDVIVASAEDSDAYAIASGTSFSSPYVAAVAALARSQDDTITSAYFEQLIKETSTDLGTASKDKYYGWGLINAEKIVKRAVYPIVCGVDNNSFYDSARTITFNKGTATLNGVSFKNGSTVSNFGQYTLVVTDEYANTTTVQFTVKDMVPPVITIAPYTTTPTNQSITVNASVNEGTLNVTSHTFTENGSFTFIATDEAGNQTPVTVTITNIFRFTTGDVTIDGNVDVLDLLKLKKYLLGQVTLTQSDTLAADVTGDGVVDVLDLLKIKKYLLGQVTL